MNLVSSKGFWKGVSLSCLTCKCAGFRISVIVQLARLKFFTPFHEGDMVSSKGIVAMSCNPEMFLLLYKYI